jgi:hypothetical protein
MVLHRSLTLSRSDLVMVGGVYQNVFQRTGSGQGRWSHYVYRGSQRVLVTTASHITSKHLIFAIQRAFQIKIN